MKRRDQNNNTPLDCAISRRRMNGLEDEEGRGNRGEGGEVQQDEGAEEEGQELHCVRILLEMGVSAKDVVRDSSALHLAVLSGNKKVVKVLLDHGAHVNATDEHLGKLRNTPLHLAAKAGHSDIAVMLVEAGADMLAVNMDCGTSMEVAARYGNVEVMEALCELGAHVEDSQLHQGAHYGRVETIQFLLRKGLDVNTTTYLHTAASQGHLAAVEVLISNGALIETVDGELNTPLNIAAANNRLSVVDFLIQQGACLETKDRQGATPLYKAAKRGLTKMAALLLAKGASLYAIGPAGLSLLHVAVQQPNNSMIQLLIDNWLHVDATDALGNTPLIYAALRNNHEGTTTLIKAGANVRTKSRSGATPLHYTIGTCALEVANILLASGVDINAINGEAKTPLHLSVLGGRLELVELMIARGANLEAEDKAGQTPLQLAIELGYLEVANKLIEGGAVVSDPFLHAVVYGDISAVTVLLEEAVEVNDGALVLAIKRGHAAIVKLLVDHEHIKLAQSSAFLRQAIKERQVEVIQELLRCGADAAEAFDDGLAALHVAVEFQDAHTTAILDALVSGGAKLDAQVIVRREKRGAKKEQKPKEHYLHSIYCSARVEGQHSIMQRSMATRKLYNGC